MVSQRDLDAFLARIRRHEGRVSQLAGRASGDPRETMLTALTELEMMYEDLLVADEELRVQGEELRASQSALSAARSRDAELFAGAPVAYVVTTADGVILEANRAAIELLGEPRRGGIGKPLQVYLDVASRAEVRRMMLNVWRDGGVGNMDVVVAPTGRRRVDVVLTVIRAPDQQGGGSTLRWGLTPRLDDGGVASGRRGGPIGLRSDGQVGPALDRDLLRALFEDTSILLLVLDRDLRVRRASAAFAGETPIDGANLESLLAAGADEIGHLARACLGAGQATRVAVDGRTCGEPDKPRSWMVSALPLAGTDGQIVAVACLLVDAASTGPG